MKASRNLDAAASRPAPCSRRTRLLRGAVSLWLVVHLSAIIIAPASVAPTSDLILSAWRVFRPYLQMLYLDHGYHFFAPEPGESTLLAFEAERPDGTVVRGRIPDRAVGPRLLYHRYFMLTEHMAQAREELRNPWHESYAKHIGRQLGAATVNLTKQTHLLATMEAVRDGVRLDDPRGYEGQTLGTFRCSE